MKLLILRLALLLLVLAAARGALRPGESLVDLVRGAAAGRMDR